MKYKNINSLCICTGVTAIAFQVLLSNNIALGGVTGLAQVLHAKLSIPYVITSSFINIPLLLGIGHCQDIKTVIKKLVSMIAFSSLLDIMPPLCNDLSSTFLGSLCLFLTAIIAGASIGALERWYNGSTGGFDMLAELLTQHSVNIRRGDVTTLINLFVLAISAIYVCGVNSLPLSIVLTIILNQSVNLTCTTESPQIFLEKFTKNLHHRFHK